MSAASSAAVRSAVVALAGNPNTGKTSLFNALCGARQRVGNYPGVTVEKKSGRVALPSGREVELLDLPGLYSLKALAPDEETAVDVVAGRMPGAARPDLIVFVLDSSNLKRNLYLFSQVAELGAPIVVAATMSDTLSKAGLEVDFERLEQFLDCAVIPVRDRDPAPLAALREAIERSLSSPRLPQLALRFPEELEKAARGLVELGQAGALTHFEARELIADLTMPTPHRVREQLDGQLEAARRNLAADVHNPAAIAVERYRWADTVVAAAERRAPNPGKRLSQRLDRWLTHRVFGLAIFAGVMYLLFQAIYSWAGPMMEAIEWAFAALGDVVGARLAATPMLQSLVVDGVIAGVGAVVVFLPQIVLLFLLIAFLEDSGYMSRAAFLMDRLLGWAGLNGRSFIPMLSSFACAIPGVMAARVIPDQRSRLTTILISPLMSCSARLPVYILLIGAFIEPRFGAAWAAFTLFAMHALGLFVALPIAWLLNRGFLKTPPTPFTLEMPPYRLPHLFDVGYRAFASGKKFLIRAGSVIFALSLVIWALTYFPRPPEVAEGIEAEFAAEIAAASDEGSRAQLEEERDNRIASVYLEQSYLGRVGHAVQPIFAPLGFDWRISVGILGAFPAREVIISTLGIVYSIGQGADEESPTLRDRLAASRHADGSVVFTPLVAVTLMVFFALCSQCMSTLATVMRELNSVRWAAFLFVYMTALAYLAGLLVYQGGRALGLA